MPARAIIIQRIASHDDVAVGDRLAAPGRDLIDKDPDDLTCSVIFDAVTLAPVDGLQISVGPSTEVNAGNGFDYPPLCCEVLNKIADLTDPLEYMVKDVQ